MQVLVIFNQETDEVQVRGPWNSEEEGDGAARAFSQGLDRKNDTTPYRLAVVGVTPMVYYDPEVHR
jgi:hypothetical protein